jgi:hypothetical protein
MLLGALAGIVYAHGSLPRAASLMFGLCGLVFDFAVLLVCHRIRSMLLQ